MTPSTWSSNRIGSTIRLAGARLAEPGGDLDVVRRRVVDEDRAASPRRPGRPAPRRTRTRSAAALRRGSRRPRSSRSSRLAVLRRRGRRRRAGRRPSGVSSPMISSATSPQVAVALHQAGDAGQVGLEPVLLLVRAVVSRSVGDHLVDVVLELGDLARGVDGDLPGQVALGDRGGHLGDGAHLAWSGSPASWLTFSVSPLQVPDDALDLGLAAQPALGADLAGDAGDLGGERRQLVDHRVDGRLQLQDLARARRRRSSWTGRRWRPRS